MLTLASVDWYTPEVLAQKLSIFTGRKFSEAEILPYAHTWLDLPDDDPRREKLWPALLDAREALEEGDLRLMALHELVLVHDRTLQVETVASKFRAILQMAQDREPSTGQLASSAYGH